MMPRDRERTSVGAHARRSHMSSVAIALAGLLFVLAIASTSSGVVVQEAVAKPRAKLVALSSLASAASSLTVAAAPSASVSHAVVAPAAPVVPPTPKLAIDRGARVLVVGDSMVDAGFSQRIGALVKERGGTVIHDAWTSSTTSSWSRGDRLTKLLATKPDVVIVALGSNEVSLPSPESNANAVRSIVARVSAATDGKCLWVGPPIWKGETGIVGVERRNAAPCGFFDSGNLNLERRRDGIHTTMKGGASWADAMWRARVNELAAAPEPSASAK